MSSGGAAEVIDLSSDDDDDVREAPGPALLYVKPIPADVKPFLLRPYPPGCGALVPVKPEAPEEPVDTPPPALEPPPLQRLCRQFWKSGEYEVSHHNSVAAPNGRNRLRINPRFLHSNATSHKWAFGAIAELLDNAIDEVNNGATYVRVNKFTNPRDGSPSLLIRDNGGGMDPESLRRCMSFGFSDKQSDAFIGQYGNGFKTSTMRLGGDVIVFTQSEKDWTTTRSIGLLSYTFLMETGSDDVLVPTVDYKYDLMTCSFSQLLRIDQKLFSSNLSILLKWSPFASEAELLKQFDDMGNHGTKIIVFNLWFNDDGDMELDFDSDKKDILITGAHKKVKMDSSDKITSGNYVSNRLRHSLRAYASVLYLHLPENFRIILRGCDVEPHHIVNDLIYRECVMYKPQTGRISEPGIITTLGFIRGAPSVDVQGFNVYHKNRLILPFWKVANNSYGKGRGVVGVLETNFIKPTHDKQDFEKSILYQRLEHRLKEMTYEYWDLHCHRVGYDNKKLRRISGAVAHVRQTKVDSPPPSLPPRLLAADIPTNSLAVVKSEAFVTREEANSQTMTPLKRKLDSPGAITRAADQYGLDHTNDVVNGHQTQHRHVSQRKRFNEFKNLTIENRKLHDQCSQYEESEKQLVLKEQNLRAQIAQARNEYEKLFEELMAFDVKTEKF